MSVLSPNRLIICAWYHYFFILKLPGNLGRTFSCKTKIVDIPYYLCGRLVYQPLLAVLGIFYISERNVCGYPLSVIRFGLPHRTNFLGCLRCIPFIEHRLLGKGKANRQKSSIHAGLRRDGSQKLTSQKTDYCTITYRF